MRPRARAASARACLAVLCFAALASVLLWPSRGFAAIVPACEGDFASQLSARTAGEELESCDDGAPQDDIDNSRVAPICDASGASAVAPPRLRGVSDVRLDKGRPCPGTDSVHAAAISDRGDAPSQAPDSVVDRVILADTLVVPHAGQALLIDPPAVASGPRAGVRIDVYHPPR